MCGIAGLISSAGFSANRLSTEVSGMAERLTHRGPDDSGVWVDESQGISLGHKRLSIIDLSAAGHQPMVSNDGAWVIVFNGEIYNHLDLRLELSSQYEFRSTSDTEVLLAALQTYSPIEALQKIRGMFAFCAWNRQTRKVLFARDRMGEKPLYLGLQGQHLFFGSELKALKALSFFDGSLSKKGLECLLRYGYITDRICIYEDVWKLSPGHFCYFDLPADLRLLDPEAIKNHSKAYWPLDVVAVDNMAQPYTDIEEASQSIKRLLKNAIREQLIADVPVGAFLSGGIDSSLICALASEASSTTLNTYSIGFTDKQYDESKFAREVATLIGANHNEFHVDTSDLLNIIPDLATVYDEPFADSSQIPSILVCRKARQAVTVCLSGDGGDELFGGYNRYSLTPALYHRFQSLPAWSARLFQSLISSSRLQNSISYFESLFQHSRTNMPSRVGERLSKLEIVANAHSPYSAFLDLQCIWQRPGTILMNSTPEQQFKNHDDGLSFLQRALLQDQKQYLPGDNLVKLDRASMSTSLEVRVPFLDHRVVEASWRCSDEFKISGNHKKLLLKHILTAYLPKRLIDRPKMGFSVPLNQWLRGDLNEWASDLLSLQSMKSEGLFDAITVNKLWNDHCNGKTNAGSQLWPILIFRQWNQARR